MEPCEFTSLIHSGFIIEQCLILLMQYCNIADAILLGNQIQMCRSTHKPLTIRSRIHKGCD